MSGASAQSTSADTLAATLREKDSLLFSVGYNQCNLEAFEQLLSNDFEFYHDQGGLTRSRSAFLRGVRKGLCRLPYTARRELVTGSLQVFPLYVEGRLYGAIQNGEHRFYAREENQEERLTSTARFTHVWMLEKGEWRLRRGLSYDHQPPGH